ncbi:deoxyuridine 5'-triphosphate nucleotidohydrolase [Methanococcus maripaludis]|uniref:Deoxyuridine 5'-triphosphate nucleotidohydrolase n=1 Tax=Methanococcus maripaludis TaxID=39152 RepID=A0A8T3VZG3_METMI|nr:deoxyuridine 5'-triphosphate nucleotidohydrolase [Methanococcus maripaludis]MBG0768684.1 deoxyuridine 5'-triphosphate nucleotidohydrolase [Methanococcus maripaludis]
MIIGPNVTKDFSSDLKEGQLQQCGIDLKLDKIYKIEGKGAIDFSNEKRVLPEHVLIFDSKKDEKIDLECGIYIVKIKEKMNIPENMAGFAYPRSTLLRMGVTLYTAVHDPGYEGYASYLMHVMNPVTMYKYAKIAQIVFSEVKDGNGTYSGIYHKK